MEESDLPPKRRGRPPKPEEERKRRHLTFRLRDELRDRLSEAASKSDRSLSEEVESRLERSLEQEQVVDRMLGDPDTATLAQLVAVTAKLIQLKTGKSWIDDRVTREMVLGAVQNVMREMYRPLREREEIRREIEEIIRDARERGREVADRILGELL